MLIRFFRELDYAPVSQLLNAVYRNPTRMAHLTPERLRTEYRNRGTNPHENCVVLESPEGELVGFCGYEPLPDGRALLDGPVLHTEFRGQGWGQRLWQEVATLLRARGIRTVSVVLGEANGEGLDFAKRVGFAPEKTDVIVICENSARHEINPPDGISVSLADNDLDLAEYEDLHASLFSRRSLAYLGVLARADNYRIFVARDGADLVGHLELEFLDEVATIEAYGVATTHRRRGIGRCLLAAALNEAWSQPGIRLVRQIWKTSEPGFIKAYLDMGFVQKAAIHGLVRQLEG
ncbi:MAG: GNAT family N-acetyltransferase [Vulcanimicrobiota bacterium]